MELGIVNIATDADGHTYTGDHVEHVRQRRATAWQIYQRTGTKAAKRRLKQLSGKKEHFRRLVNHTISKRLVAYAKDTKAALLLEDLTNIRDRMTARTRQHAKRHGWSFRQLRHFPVYKA